MSRPIERILMTGAAGGLGKAMRERLKGHFRLLRLSDISPMEPAVEGEEVPVWAMPTTSRPASTAGIACAWIAVGVV